MKRSILPVLIPFLCVWLAVMMLAGCSSMLHNQGETPLAKVFNDIGAAQDVYNASGPILQQLRASGLITHDQWNGTVVPIDTAVNEGFGETPSASSPDGSGVWGALYAWKASGSDTDKQKVLAALKQLDADLAKYAQISGDKKFADAAKSISVLTGLAETILGGF